MTDDDLKIFVDATRPATLNDGAGRLTDCATLQEAVLAWHALPSSGSRPQSCYPRSWAEIAVTLAALIGR